MSANEAMVEAFCELGASKHVKEKTVHGLEKFICKLYALSVTVESLDQMRWKLFSKRKAEGAKLPPTQETLKQAIYRAHYQALIWQNDIVPNPDIPPPQNYGWRKDDRYVPISSVLPAAPDAVVQLVRCSCRKSKCPSPCSCRRNNLSCTNLCQCESGPDLCSNVYVLDTDFLFEEIDNDNLMIWASDYWNLWRLLPELFDGVWLLSFISHLSVVFLPSQYLCDGSMLYTKPLNLNFHANKTIATI